MKQTVLLAILFMLLVFPQPVQAQGYSVEASSHNWLAQRDYSECRIADDNPDTAWAEGGQGAGEGEWVSFQFDAPLHLARIGIRNGDQREGSWESCNRVRKVRVEYGSGREKVVELRNQTGLQYVDIKSDHVDELTLTIVSVYPAENIWNQSVTCLSDVTFEVYADAAGVPATPTASDQEQPAEPQPRTPESELALAGGGNRSEADAPITVSAKPEKPLAAPEEAPALLETELPAQSADSGADLNDTSAEMDDPRGEAVHTVREYYSRLNTLDETFPDLMAAKVYEQELLSFLYFEEIQKQLGTADRLRDAEVDLSALVIEVQRLTGVTARVTSKGAYVVATPGQKLMVDEDSRFDLVVEQGVWKIEKKIEE